MGIEGIRQRGHPKKTWWDCVKNDMESVGLSQKDAQSRNKWRRRIKGQPANRGSPGKMAINLISTYTLFDHQTDWCNPKISLSSSLFFLSFSLTPHIHLMTLISMRFSFNSCSTFIGQVSLPCIRQLTQVTYNLPFSFNENSFPVRMVRYSRNFFQAHLTLGVTAESQPPSASNISPKITEFIYLSQRYPITNIQMQISIKPIPHYNLLQL